MPVKMSDPDMMQKKIMKSRHDAEEPKTKEGIESGRDAGDQIKTKGSNPGVMLEKSKQNEGIEFWCDVEEPETKRRDQIQARC